MPGAAGDMAGGPPARGRLALTFSLPSLPSLLLLLPPLPSLLLLPLPLPFPPLPPRPAAPRGGPPGTTGMSV
jgi:hypothetical protein